MSLALQNTLIVEAIFKYLKVNELMQVQLVNSVWREEAAKLLKKHAIYSVVFNENPIKFKKTDVNDAEFPPSPYNGNLLLLLRQISIFPIENLRIHADYINIIHPHQFEYFSNLSNNLGTLIEKVGPGLKYLDMSFFMQDRQDLAHLQHFLEKAKDLKVLKLKIPNLQTFCDFEFNGTYESVKDLELNIEKGEKNTPEFEELYTKYFKKVLYLFPNTKGFTIRCLSVKLYEISLKFISQKGSTKCY